MKLRSIWALAGLLALALGVAGVVLPLLPSVPFLLLAAFCFSKSSPRMHAWLVDHPTLGPPIRDWQRNGAVRRPIKAVAVLSMAGMFGLSVWLGFGTLVLGIQAAVLSCVAIFIATRPDR